MGNESFKYYARFSAIALQMGVTIFAGAYVGKWLDSKYSTDKNWFTIVLTISSVAIALISVLKQVNKINKEVDEENDKKN